MQITFFRSIWGMEEPTLEKNLKRIKEAGFDGVEMMVPLDKPGQQKLSTLLQDLELDLIASQWAAHGNTFSEYLQSFETHLYANAHLNPLFSNSQTGKDYYSPEQTSQLIERAAQIAQETQVPVLHETHRGKFTFHTRSTEYFLQKHPDLRLTADFSHWCTVCESYLEDQKEIMELAISRTDHIHARVGHPQAAQVSDPRAPEWQEALQHHLHWWDAIVANHQKKGSAVLTICPEFGPYPYLPQEPYTQKPLADLWEVNVYMKDLLQKRYSSD
ncbi:hypothetical protein AHMF7616_01620 [Adhaeribacter pallidiroseus]|uniref:Xylose isomerase-like TIM barrel domain-containing protein n=2 Tax=Adhaeribacter pallidiroseus TaxID=2072847 RepID=A0A369QDP5_9BACT|nr:hypothetical protein AHMF7616_01620 [Adhaeribacter pallidiroseus]